MYSLFIYAVSFLCKMPFTKTRRSSTYGFKAMTWHISHIFFVCSKDDQFVVHWKITLKWHCDDIKIVRTHVFILNKNEKLNNKSIAKHVFGAKSKKITWIKFCFCQRKITRCPIKWHIICSRNAYKNESQMIKHPTNVIR